MKDVGVPNGLYEIGFKDNDIKKLVDGTLPQHRVTKLSPKVFDEKDLGNLFYDSMKLW
jgi:hydroxyacid-oxoacid transhydrogenase